MERGRSTAAASRSSGTGSGWAARKRSTFSVRVAAGTWVMSENLVLRPVHGGAWRGRVGRRQAPLPPTRGSLMLRRVLTVAALTRSWSCPCWSRPSQARRMPSRTTWLARHPPGDVRLAGLDRRNRVAERRQQAGRQPRHRQHLAGDATTPRGKAVPGHPALREVRQAASTCAVLFNTGRNAAGPGPEPSRELRKAGLPGRRHLRSPHGRGARRTASSAAARRSSTRASRSSPTSATGAPTSSARTTSGRSRLPNYGNRLG